MSLGKVLVTAKSVASSESALESLRQAGCEVQIASPPEHGVEDWLVAQVRDVDGAIFAMERVTARVLEAANRLKIIARPGVGYDTVDMVAANRRGVMVTIAAGTNDASVADFAFGLMLMGLRSIATGARSVAQHGWERPMGIEAWNKTLAVVGMGRIGLGIAKRARGFEMRVLGVTRTPDPALATSLGIEFMRLEDALPIADIVCLAAPLTPETENMINATTLASMKRGAFLVNIGRGGLIDEEALAAAVRAGNLAGAAVDVLRVQGAASPSPLIGVPGIIVTPHMASLTREASHRVAHAAAASIVAALRGETPPFVVNTR